MRLPITEHISRPWRIHDIASDFVVEDVWALPVHGDADDFADLIDLMTSEEDVDGRRVDFLDSAAARFLWRLRDLLGKVFRLGGINESADAANARVIPGDVRTSLAERMDADLRGTADGVRFTAVPMTALYRLDDEFAAEISNATMHGVMHLSWIRRRTGVYQGQLAVLVKPRGILGRVYMAVIKPFRYLIVYPALLRHIEKTWFAAHRTLDEIGGSPRHSQPSAGRPCERVR